MSLRCFSLVSSEMFQPTNRFWYQFVGQVIKNVFKHKNISHITVGISKGMKKNVIFISAAHGVETLIRN